MPKVYSPKMLRDIHIDWLTRKHTLERQVSLSLEQRCAEFERYFRGKKLTPYRLRLVYKKAGIKKKMIQNVKPINEVARRKIRF